MNYFITCDGDIWTFDEIDIMNEFINLISNKISSFFY